MVSEVSQQNINLEDGGESTQDSQDITLNENSLMEQAVNVFKNLFNGKEVVNKSDPASSSTTEVAQPDFNDEGDSPPPLSQQMLN